MLPGNDAFYLGFYWGSREESAESIAARAEPFLQSLHEISPLFTGWEPVNRKSSRQFSANRKHLEELFRAGVNRKDIGKEEIPELGFRVALLSGPNDFGPIKLAITAGCYSKWNSNVCLIELPSFGTDGVEILTIPTLTKLCESVVTSWEPDKGLVSSWALHKAVPQDDDGVNFGWLTYLSSMYEPMPHLGPPAREVGLGQSGHLIVATDEKFSSANPKHLDALRHVISAFGSR